MVLVVAALGGLFRFMAVWKVFKAIIGAVFVAAIVATGLYFLLPRLQEQPGAVGDMAHKAKAVIDDANIDGEALMEKGKEKVKDLKDKVEAIQNIIQKTE